MEREDIYYRCHVIGLKILCTIVRILIDFSQSQSDSLSVAPRKLHWNVREIQKKELIHWKKGYLEKYWWEYVNVNDKLSINKRSEGQLLHRIQSYFWVILCFNRKILINLCILLVNLWAHAHCTQKLTHSLHLSVALWAQPIATESPIAKKTAKRRRKGNSWDFS